MSAGEAPGRPGDVGTIAVGHYGDLAGVAGDPLKDASVLQSVAVVIKGGQVVKQARLTEARAGSGYGAAVP